MYLNYQFWVGERLSGMNRSLLCLALAWAQLLSIQVCARARATEGNLGEFLPCHILSKHTSDEPDISRMDNKFIHYNVRVQPFLVE